MNAHTQNHGRREGGEIRGCVSLMFDVWALLWLLWAVVAAFAATATPRAPQEEPGAAQERPKSGQERATSDARATYDRQNGQDGPRAAQEETEDL